MASNWIKMNFLIHSQFWNHSLHPVMTPAFTAVGMGYVLQYLAELMQNKDPQHTTLVFPSCFSTWASWHLRLRSWGNHSLLRFPRDRCHSEIWPKSLRTASAQGTGSWLAWNSLLLLFLRMSGASSSRIVICPFGWSSRGNSPSLL